MGEAKRRKQLGLMPTVHPFEAVMDADGHVTVTRGPGEADLRERIETALKSSQPSGAGWDSEYRTAAVMAGRVDRTLETAQDVGAIPVPGLRRFSGDLVLGAPGGSGVSIPALGGSLRLRDERYSFDGTRWESFPTGQDPRQVLERLMGHPALNLQGEVVASFLVEHWPEGRIDIEPEPPEEVLEAIEDVAREWHGATPGEWAQTHHELLEDEDAPVPVARRLRLEVRRPSPLQSPLRPAFATRGELEFHPDPDGSSYTLDGETWLPYGDPDAAPQEDAGELGELGDLLTGMLDVQTVPVTVWQDGRVEWAEGDVPAEHAERLRGDLLTATGAGQPGQWAEWTRALLTETFGDEAAYLADVALLPEVRGVRLDIPVDALTDPDDPAQYFIESEVTFDGETWRDLYAEEVPEELERLRPSN